LEILDHGHLNIARWGRVNESTSWWEHTVKEAAHLMAARKKRETLEGARVRTFPSGTQLQ
jgi:hypothetical protein